MFMSSSDPGNLCYVETANLDGETNLKIKYCFGQTAGVHTADQLTDFEERWVVILLMSICIASICLAPSI